MAAFRHTNINNQNVPLEIQLSEGIRGFKIPIHLNGNNATVCHGVSEEKKLVVQDKVCTNRTSIYSRVCSLFLNSVKPCFLDNSRQLLSLFLVRVKTFLVENPHEVLTLFMEDYVPFSHLNDSFVASNITSYLHVQPKNEEWPTLGEMIVDNKRLVVFSNRDVDKNNVTLENYPFNSERHFVWSTPYDFKSTSDLIKDMPHNLTAEMAWGNATEVDNKLWVMQHFVTPLIAGRVMHAVAANHRYSLQIRHERYKRKLQTNANYIWVDFYQYPRVDGFFEYIKWLNEANNAYITSK